MGIQSSGYPSRAVIPAAARDLRAVRGPVCRWDRTSAWPQRPRPRALDPGRSTTARRGFPSPPRTGGFKPLMAAAPGGSRCIEGRMSHRPPPGSLNPRDLGGQLADDHHPTDPAHRADVRTPHPGHHRRGSERRGRRRGLRRHGRGRRRGRAAHGRPPASPGDPGWPGTRSERIRTNPAGSTCCRNRRRNSAAVSSIVRRLPPLGVVLVPERPGRPPARAAGGC